MPMLNHLAVLWSHANVLFVSSHVNLNHALIWFSVACHIATKQPEKRSSLIDFQVHQTVTLWCVHFK